MFPGAVIGVSRKGTKYILPVGTFAYDTEHVSENTLYDCASITKSIPTASLALTFIAEKKLRLKDKVKKFIPELHNDHGATIEDLLLYRVRGPRLSDLRFKTFEEIRTHILEHGFDAPPGESVYTNLPTYILGIVLERIAEVSIAESAQTYFFDPLKMGHTTFFPTASDCAPTEIQDGEMIQGVVHDESARVFAKERRSVGHAGLFSTASDLLLFLEPLMNGEFPAILKGAEKGLGWEKNAAHFMGNYTSHDTFGKTGFTGTSIIVDRKKDTALVILSNRTYPIRPPNSSAINTFRRDIADIVFG